MATVEELWAAFCAVRPDLAAPETKYEAWHFCDNQADADALVELVLSGTKRATASALWSYEAEDDPLPGPATSMSSPTGEARRAASSARLPWRPCRSNR